MKNYLNSLIIGLFVLASVLVLSHTYKTRFRSLDTIKVTGLGKKDFKSDLIVWEASFSKKEPVLQKAYKALKQDRERVKQFLTRKGVNPDEITFSSVDINKEYINYYDERNRMHTEFSGYRLTQRVKIESKQVDKIERIAREITDLINDGVEIESEEPQYYYTKLSELKIEMIASATKDARLRAEKIAANAGAKLGELRSARMGIFQIIGQHSNEDYSWGGTFNTSSKMKTATITMRLTYGIK